VSGLTFVVERARPAGQRVSDVRVGGQPLDTARLYAVATNDFLAGGGDGYTVFRAGRDWRDTQVLLRDLFIEYIRRTATVSARTEGRIVIR
jgi:5'-nucleotidase